jgi:hypothetical protein
MIAAFVPGLAGGADVRAKADINCQSSGKPLQYDCAIQLTNARTGQPLTGIDLTVSFDMASMPGMHNLPPVKAASGQAPGLYHAPIALEMLGDWTVRLDLAGPLRDRVVKVLRFEEDRAGPANPPNDSPARHGH